MTEEQIKTMCKFMLENGNRDFTELEKEMLKQAIDQAKNWQELFTIAIASNYVGRPKK